MKLADISERATQRPFRPFVIETQGGRIVEVENESDIFLSPRRPDLVIVFDPEGRVVILEVDTISSVEPKIEGEKPAQFNGSHSCPATSKATLDSEPLEFLVKLAEEFEFELDSDLGRLLEQYRAAEGEGYILEKAEIARQPEYSENPRRALFSGLKKNWRPKKKKTVKPKVEKQPSQAKPEPQGKLSEQQVAAGVAQLRAFREHSGATALEASLGRQE